MYRVFHFVRGFTCSPAQDQEAPNFLESLSSGTGTDDHPDTSLRLECLFIDGKIERACKSPHSTSAAAPVSMPSRASPGRQQEHEPLAQL